MSDHNLTTVKFASLDLEPALLQGIAEAGFERCTPIQAAALPKALTGHDVQGQAQTGTGKTAAFLLATMNRLLRTAPADGYQPGQPRALIVAPTRELAVQIHKDAEVLGRHTGLRMGVVFGGTGYDTQREMLRAGLDILIGTPGRLIDYFKQHVFSLSYIDVVVMDEADRMFDLGFIKDVRYLMRRMPPATRRLNMLFSATLSLRVQELAYEHMNAPEMIDASPTDEVTVSRVTQVLYHVSKDEKIPLLLGLLGKGDATRTMVFVNTRRGAERVSNYLEGNGYPCAVLTGDVPQKTRLALLERFTRGEVPVLVATDVAARGLHIPEVTHVVNFDLPQDPEDYVHRVGRTARAGASGDAVSFACEEYVFGLEEIESFIGQRIPVLQVRDEDLVTPAPPARSRYTRPRDGRRDGRPEGGRGRSRGSDRDRGRDGRGPRPPRRETAPASAPSEAVQEPAVEPAPAPAPDASPAAEAKPPRRRRTRSRRGAEAGDAAEATAVESASPPGETPAVAEPAGASEPSAEDASPRPRRRRTRTRRATASETGDDQAATAETSPATDAEVEAGTPATPDGAASSEARPRRRRRRRTRSGSDSGADVAPATPDAAD